MKLSTTSSELLGQLQTASRVASTRSAVQALSGVQFHAEAGVVELRATDMEVGLRVPLIAQVEREGTVVLPARLLLDVARQLPDGPVTLELRAAEQDVEIICGPARFHLRTLRTEDFPPLPEPGGDQVVHLPAKAFTETIAKVARSASRDETRPILTGILVSASGTELRMVATDSYRLSVKETRLEVPVDGGFEANVPARALPEVRPSIGTFATTRPEALHGHAVPVSGVAGDQQAALYGQGCLEPGQGKNTYGTGSFVLLNSGAAPPLAPPGLLTTVAWQIGERTVYALEAAIFVTGAAVQWLRDGLGIIEAAAETEALAASLAANDGVYFVPALTGLGSPHWDPYARGTITGLTRGAGRAHLARATLEAIAYQTVDAVRAMEAASGTPLTELKADGGATVNGWLMQFQADVLGVPVVVAEITETTALGAAMLAGVGAGVFTQADVGRTHRSRAQLEPRMGEDERLGLLAGWHDALARARGVAPRE